MRARIGLALVTCACSALLFATSASAQESGPDELPSAPAPDDAEGYVSLSADDLAQLSLGGFRRYLNRIRATDAELFAQLDPQTAALEERDTVADVIFGTATSVSVAALVAAVPVYTEIGAPTGSDVAIGLVVAGLSTFALGVIIQAIVRPGHSDLVALIDRHDELVGRR
jgi:hypothetical protein